MNLIRPEYIDDTKRIRRVASDNGIELSLEDAEAVWLAYSDSMAAGWMMLPDTDEELWDQIKGI